MNKPSGRATMTPAVAESVNYTRWVVDTILPFVGSRVLEVGLGFGNYRGQLGGLECYVGVDIDKDAVAYASAMHQDSVYHCLDVSNTNSIEVLKSYELDTVICINVLEHIEDDMLAANNLLQVLKPRGKLVLFVPAFPALFGDMDDLAGHHRRYTQESVRELFLGNNEARIIKSSFMNPVGGLGWWINTFRNHDRLDSDGIEGQVRFFDKYCVPVSRLLTPLFSRWFGQSLLFVVEREK